MSLFIKIIDVHAREILDSRGNPTVEVEVTRRDRDNRKKDHGARVCSVWRKHRALEAIELGMEKNGVLGWVVRK